MIHKQSIALHLDQTIYQAAYWEAGKGQPIVLLHGFMGRGECWETLVSALKPHYRCICLDMLGFGESSKPMIRYDIALLVRFVRAVVTALAIEPCGLIGHSLGGWVSAAYALTHPDSVTALVLAAPAGIRDDSFCGRYDHLRPLLWQTPIVDAALWFLQPLARISGNQKSLAQIRWMRRELNGQPAPRSFLLGRMRPEDAIDTVEKEIHQLTVPTLVITGEQDETIPLWHSQTYANKIPQAQLALIPNADHALPQRYASEMVDILLPFLSQTQRNN
ncbi:MAG: alpha/beta hydrolase [Cyanobacteria bacterium RM1_2_2]|nr:alpha/beta hydrolase [Cyanobacteria bacterium RM1_2_2]